MTDGERDTDAGGDCEPLPLTLRVEDADAAGEDDTLGLPEHRGEMDSVPLPDAVAGGLGGGLGRPEPDGEPVALPDGVAAPLGLPPTGEPDGLAVTSALPLGVSSGLPLAAPDPEGDG